MLISKKNRLILNPLLTLFEIVFVDWWLNFIFGVMYTPTGFSVRESHISKIVNYMGTKGVPVIDDMKNAALVNGLSMLKTAEKRLIYKTPLRFVFLGVVIYIVSPNMYRVSPEISQSVITLSALFVFLGFYEYFKARYAVYRMYRFLHD